MGRREAGGIVGAREDTAPAWAFAREQRVTVASSEPAPASSNSRSPGPIFAAIPSVGVIGVFCGVRPGSLPVN